MNPSSLLTIALAAVITLSDISHADMLDHLKKAEGKSGNHSMRNIDFIYMINLDQRPEKFAEATKDLHRYGIFPYRFSAVNGWEMSVETINEIGLKYQPGMTSLYATSYPPEAEGKSSHGFMTEYGKTYFRHTMVRGTLGCALSHISILKDAWDSGYEVIWVMEDDVQVLRDPRTIPDLIDKLNDLVGKGNWDVLFTDQDYRMSESQYMIAYGASKRPDMDCSREARFAERFTQRYDISPDFRRISARFCTHSMIISRSGIAKLLEFSLVHKIFSAYDLDNYLHPTIQRYSFTYDIVSNIINGLSDNSAPGYQGAK